MKICVLISSYEGTGEEFREVPPDYQDPSIWASNHDFILKYVTKEDAIEKITEVLGEGYDFIWNFMWGLESYCVAGVEATRYLESTGYPMLGTSSKYMSLTKLDFKIAAAQLGIPTPKWTVASNLDMKGMNYPLIVKPSDGYCSLHMSKNSICKNVEQVLEQTEYLKGQKHNPVGDVLIEEFIPGDDVSCMVLETWGGVVALLPIIYEYPQGKGEFEHFLDWNSKCAPLLGLKEAGGLVTYRIMEDGKDEMVGKIQDASVDAFVSLGVAGSGYARVDLRIHGDQVFVLEVNHTPAFFCPKGNLYGDDDVIEKTFPGGHNGLVDAIISAKKVIEGVKGFYDTVSLKYDEAFHTLRNLQVWEEIVDAKNFSGSVLDLGSGTGYLGNLILDKSSNCELVGIDASEKMAEFARRYSKIHIGLIQNVMGELGRQFDHIVGYGVFFALDNANFEKTLCLCFATAEKSITLTVEDIRQEVTDAMLQCDPTFMTHNNVPILEILRFRRDGVWIFGGMRKPGNHQVLDLIFLQ